MTPIVLLFISTLVITTASANLGSTGCVLRSTLMICREAVPNSEDLDVDRLDALVINRLPENSWLSIGDPEFPGAGLQKVEIQRSSIGRIDPGYFAQISGTNKLKRLKFRMVKGPVVVDANMLKGLKMSLNYLQVENSLAVNIADLAEMEALTDLELVGTKLIGSNADFERLIPRLSSLEIKNCDIDTLPWEAVAQWVAKYDTVNLKINENDWKCDCSIAALKRLQPGVVQRYVLHPYFMHIVIARPKAPTAMINVRSRIGVLLAAALERCTCLKNPCFSERTAPSGRQNSRRWKFCAIINKRWTDACIFRTLAWIKRLVMTEESPIAKVARHWHATVSRRVPYA